MGRRLGKGSVGLVYEGKWKAQACAVKVVIPQGKGPREYLSYLKESAHHKTVRPCRRLRRPATCPGAGRAPTVFPPPPAALPPARGEPPRRRGGAAEAHPGHGARARRQPLRPAARPATAAGRRPRPRSSRQRRRASGPEAGAAPGARRCQRHGLPALARHAGAARAARPRGSASGSGAPAGLRLSPHPAGAHWVQPAGVVHSNLKSSNLLLTDGFEIKARNPSSISCGPSASPARSPLERGCGWRWHRLNGRSAARGANVADFRRR